MKRNFLGAALLAAMVWACGPAEKPKDSAVADELAADYVKLVLRVGQYDGDVVDAYYGPEEWKPSPLPAADSVFPAQQMAQEAAELQAKLDALVEEGKMDERRAFMMGKQLKALHTKIRMMGGVEMSFDEEAMALYDAEPPYYSQAHFDSLLHQLDSLVPGEGPLSERFVAYVEDFIIPKDRLDTVFQTAISEARKRTNAVMQLPEDEEFVLEYVNDKSWSGYNYFQGGHASLIQINTDFPIFIERAIDLACHEGYPGHHVYNTLLEMNLVETKGWKEFSVYPLFSPQSLIAEGSANYGIDVAFPGEERMKYEAEVLFPLAGLDPTEAPRYHAIQGLRHDLNYANNEAARLYLGGRIDRDSAAQWLETYLLYEPDRALQRTRFIDQYRAYVINYNLGQDLVADWVSRNGGTVDQPARRWEVFQMLLSNPYTASLLQE